MQWCEPGASTVHTANFGSGVKAAKAVPLHARRMVPCDATDGCLFVDNDGTHSVCPMPTPACAV